MKEMIIDYLKTGVSKAVKYVGKKFNSIYYIYQSDLLSYMEKLK